VVTFLFTDIEGSTRRWEADANAMRAALLVHDQVLRTAIETHGGYLFSHTGDGVVAAFASPKCAVDAAVAAQRALELPVRMGVASVGSASIPVILPDGKVAVMSTGMGYEFGSSPQPYIAGPVYEKYDQGWSNYLGDYIGIVDASGMVTKAVKLPFANGITPNNTAVTEDEIVYAAGNGMSTTSSPGLFGLAFIGGFTVTLTLYAGVLPKFLRTISSICIVAELGSV
jgi:hypothetical protein